ncbi:MAG: hypothetical protein L6R38_006914 [Xanthoria sp. 2 TBL-2021]|nr:MAG: hypothetical protein L6R38_006914 [Xanthoria sp. 2 TBL-2021]
MASASQLYLLADHIKLSLLERQRAISLNLEPNSQDGHISRSLDSFREGIEGLEQQQRQLAGSDSSTSIDLQEQIQRLRSQYDDLTSQFRGFPSESNSSTAQPNNPTLTADFARPKDRRPRIPSSSSFKRSTGTSPNPSKSVRFTDSPSSSAQDDAAEAANRAALFPYRDEPEPPDQSHLDNQQVHEYHKNVMQQQDEQLDRLGDSIGRQRELSMQIGDELDEHVQMLDEVEGHVDRHQTTLDGARKRLGNFARKARDNKQLTIILVLIMVLIILILLLK